MSFAVTIEPRGLGPIQERLKNLGALQMAEVMDAVGQLVEGQTHRRIREEQTTPEGAPFAEWSPEYAATRKSGQKKLFSGGDLDDSIQHFLDPAGGQVEIGTNLVYAATHQFGRGGIPARPFLGLSGENLREIDRLVTEILDPKLEGRP